MLWDLSQPEAFGESAHVHHGGLTVSGGNSQGVSPKQQVLFSSPLPQPASDSFRAQEPVRRRYGLMFRW